MPIYFARHTSTSWNLAGRTQGRTDIPLCSAGVDEAKYLADQLKDVSLDVIFSSDLSRALHTAGVIGDALVVPVRAEPLIRECSFGKIEGTSERQAFELYGPRAVINWKMSPLNYDFRLWGGESRDDVFNRHAKFYRHIVSCMPANILVIGHGCGLNTLLDGLGLSGDLKMNEVRLIYPSR